MDALIGFLFFVAIIVLIVFSTRRNKKKNLEYSKRYMDVVYEKHNTHSLIMFSIKGINKFKGNKAGYYENVELVALLNNQYDPYAVEVKINNKIAGYISAGNSYLHNYILSNYNGTLKCLFAVIENGYSVEDKKKYLFGKVSLTKEDSKAIDSEKCNTD